MKRRFPGLHPATQPAEVPDGVYLARVYRAQYHWHQQKPFYAVQFSVLEPKPFAGYLISGRIYCTEKALWKLSWFLRDFGFTHTTVNGTSLLSFVGFAPAARWEELAGSGTAAGSEVA